jgi:hypothetical protein
LRGTSCGASLVDQTFLAVSFLFETSRQSESAFLVRAAKDFGIIYVLALAGRPLLTGRSLFTRRPDAIDLGLWCRNINLPSPARFPFAPRKRQSFLITTRLRIIVPGSLPWRKIELVAGDKYLSDDEHTRKMIKELKIKGYATSVLEK